MISEISVISGKIYPMSMVLSVAGVSSAAWYGNRARKEGKLKTGPKTPFSDDELLIEIKKEILDSRFHSEGYKKVRARLKRRGIRAGKNRVYNIMKQHTLLAPVRACCSRSRGR